MIELKTPIDLDYIKPDKSFIYPLYSETGELILESRAVLTAERIREIKQKYGNIIYYINTIEAPLIPKKNIENAVAMSREILNEILNYDKLTAESYAKTEKMIDTLVSGINASDIIALNLLKQLKSYEEYLYHHSVNVGILSALMAKKTGKYDGEGIKNIALGAFLIDIGQMKIDKQLLKHSGTYTISEMEKMKRHPQLGYELLKQIAGVNPIVSQTVLFHHEKMNDRGYYRLPYENLPLPPKIASLCDIFDALTSQRPYRDAYTVTYALKHLVNAINIDFNHELVSIFINHLGSTLNNNRPFYSKNDFCELNTNEIALIKEFGRHDTLKPVILTFSRFHKVKNQLSINFYRRPIEIDLQKDPDRYITKFITGKNQIESLKINLTRKKILLDYI